MKYIPNIGRVYDTVFYGVIYFNKATVKKIFADFDLNTDDAFTFYDEVKNSCKPLPQCLYPFFYYDGTKSSVLMDYMRKNLDFRNHSIEDFFNHINNKTKLKEHTFNHLFDNLSKSDREKLIKKDSRTVLNVFQNQAWSAELKEQTNHLLHHFPYVSDLLYEHLTDVNKYISEMHDKYNDIIEKRIRDTSDKESLFLFDKLYSLNEKTASKQFFSLSFMNQLVVYGKDNGGKESVFILGNKFKKNLLFRSKNKNVPINKFFYILGDPIRFNVIQLFKQHGMLTLSDVSRLANISTSTAFNILNVLSENLVIQEKHREGKKIFFSLNLDFFISSKEKYDEYISKITSIEEGNNKNEKEQ